MGKNRYQAFNEEQLALLQSLKTDHPNKPINRKERHATKKKADSEVLRARGQDFRAGRERSEGDLLVSIEHAGRSEKGDFSWIPNCPNPLIEHMLSTSVSVGVKRQNLTIVGHAYWKFLKSDAAVRDSVYLGDNQYNVALSRIDPGVEQAFSEKRLAWVAKIHRGEAVAWHPVYMQVSDTNPQTGLREIYLNIDKRRQQPVQDAISAGILCLAVLNKTFSMPRSTKPMKLVRRTKPRRERTHNAPPPSPKRYGTYREGSSLIPSPQIRRGSVKAPPENTFSDGRSKKVRAKKARKLIGVELCARCGGGELPNCSQCDGTGYYKRYERDGRSPSIITLGRNTELSGVLSIPNHPGSPSSVADHEAVGRADPRDANRHASTGMRDGSQFGSMPLHDDYDD